MLGLRDASIAELEEATEPYYFYLYNHKGTDSCGDDHEGFICKKGPIEFTFAFAEDPALSSNLRELRRVGFKASASGTYFIVVTAVCVEGKGSIVVTTPQGNLRQDYYKFGLF